MVSIIDALDDTQLLDVGVFDWARRYPLSRWISRNTTAWTYVRRALRGRGS